MSAKPSSYGFFVAIVLSYLVLAPLSAFFPCFTALAVTPLPVPNIPPLKASTGRVLERLPDGSVIVGGDFTYVNGTPIGYVAKFDGNGNLVSSWHPEPNGPVYDIEVVGDYAYLGGLFQSVGGQPASNLARVRLDTGIVDTLWSPEINNHVRRILLDGNGGLIIAGDFGSIDGISRNRLARILVDTGSLDPAWQHTLQLARPDALLVSGSNLFVSDQGRVHKLAISTGAQDLTWVLEDPNSSSIPALVDHDGFLYLGGSFSQLRVGGAIPVARNGIARVSLTSPFALDAAWNPNVTGGPINAMDFDTGGFAYIVGGFTSVGGAARGQIAKISTSGAGAPAAQFVFNNSFFRQFYDVLLTQTQVYIAGGQNLLDFGVPDRRFGMVSFNLSNSQLTPKLYDLGVSGKVSSIARQPDGAYIVGGSFQKAGTRERLNIFRQLATGELDLGWNPAASAEVRTVAATDTSVFVGGLFGVIGGISRPQLAKVDSFGLGVVDAAWAPDVTGNFGTPQVMKVDEARQMVVVGLERGLLRIPILGNGQPDPTWDAAANASIVTIDIAPNGMVYAGGDGGSPGNHLRRYFPTSPGPTPQDGTWHPRPSNPVSAIHVGADGWIYVGGSFSSIGQQLRSLVARVSATGIGLADPVWDPQANIGTSQNVRGIVFDGVGFVYLGGTFTTLGGQPALGLARVSSSGEGLVDSQWDPDLSGGYVNSLQFFPGELAVTGEFSRVDGTLRLGAMALPLDAGPDPMFKDSFE